MTEKYNIVSDDVVGATITKQDGVGDIHEFCLKLHEYMTKNFDYKLIKQKTDVQDNRVKNLYLTTKGQDFKERLGI